MPVTVNITGSLLPLLRTKVKTLTSMLRLKAPAILFFGSSEVYFYTIPPPFFFFESFRPQIQRLRSRQLSVWYTHSKPEPEEPLFHFVYFHYYFVPSFILFVTPPSSPMMANIVQVPKASNFY